MIFTFKIKNTIFALFGFLGVSGCSNNWSAADRKFHEFYKLKYGQKYETIRNVYVLGEVGYPSRELAGDNSTRLPVGTKFVARKISVTGSYNNGYFYRPYGEVVYPEELKGIFFRFDNLLVDNRGKVYSYPYVRSINE